jgi:uncharacterized protein (TIGR02118 family)
MATAIALYNTPDDVEAFDSYYTATHVPLAKKMAGLRSYRINLGPVMTPAGPAPYHLAAVLSFDSMADLQAALASTEGQAVISDLANFATAGVTVLMFDDHKV